jgi:WD40 repeat protein
VTLDGHTDEIRSLAWSPNGRLLASCAGKKDARVGIWTSAINGPAAMLGGPSREIVGICWSVDGAWISAASADATLRYWDTYQRLGEPIGFPVKLESAPLCLAGSQVNGMIAMSFSDLLIQVFQMQNIS